MQTLYGLYHDYTTDSGDSEEKLLGIYSSRERAEQTRIQLLDKPGFRDHPDGFNIVEIEVDKGGWEGGFIRGNPYDTGEFEYDDRGFRKKRDKP